jgi:multisubunit Na+/H+ antiporter MnhB subunit
MQAALAFAALRPGIGWIRRTTTIISPSIAYFATLILLVGHIEPPTSKVIDLKR